ncbi:MULTISPECIES: hypothetical protein [unclassified Bradyrhizobium]|jgi:hypothetical protein|uniref:hypothetical protein n=1 Tax=unclassified Bradyrhizobium TaxID=2631580 RepID=UPI001046D6DE|nr:MULTISPECIES: hypothetical protein [unclassified Bradyrhizobium]
MDSDLAELIDLIDRYSASREEWETEVLLAKLREQEQAICRRAPHLARFAHAAIEGALYVRRQADASRMARSSEKEECRERNYLMAAECISRRADSAYDDLSDIQLMIRVGALPRYGLAKSQARAAILDGLRDPRNIEKIKQFGDHGEPNRRRSIFNGTKNLSCQCPRTASIPHPSKTPTRQTHQP